MPSPPPSRLTTLQLEVLRALANIEPRFALTGGGALAGAWLGHRETRDLDLFWHGREALEPLVDSTADRLRAAGFGVAVLESAPSFARLAVTRGDDSTVVDLVADPVPVIAAPVLVDLDGVLVFVDTEHEILVNKLTTLLSRSEVRDLIDVDALLRNGGDLDRALADAPFKDAGFSCLTLAWVLEQMPIAILGRAAKLSPDVVEGLVGFRRSLVESLRRATDPGA